MLLCFPILLWNLIQKMFGNIFSKYNLWFASFNLFVYIFIEVGKQDKHTKYSVLLCLHLINKSNFMSSWAEMCFNTVINFNGYRNIIY